MIHPREYGSLEGESWAPQMRLLFEKFCVAGYRVGKRVVREMGGGELGVFRRVTGKAARGLGITFYFNPCQ